MEDLVHWDQRGAGKTLTRNPDELPTVELMLQDLFEVVQYLKRKYNKKKIVIFGHSWGSDWLAPYVIAEDYFKDIKAPNKEIFVIHNVGHFLMMDQPDLALSAKILLAYLRFLLCVQI
jgi:pimeloyl-ACP methyl ester carboxylesterase